jgi:predicted nucleic acid-binding protein
MNKLGERCTLKWILRNRGEPDLSDEELKTIYNKMYDNFFKKYKFVQLFYLELEGWEKAIDLSLKSNIATTDLIHLATALLLDCDLLVTSDEFFCKQANKFIPSCLPEHFQKKLKELGF